MKSEKKKILKDRFWKAETSEVEEKWLEENADPEQDRLLYDYFASMRTIAGERKAAKNTRARMRPIHGKHSWLRAAAAAAAILIAVVFAMEFLPVSSGPEVVQQQDTLSEEELAIAVAVMDKFHRSWEKGSEAAGKTFEKLEKFKSNKNN